MSQIVGGFIGIAAGVSVGSVGAFLIGRFAARRMYAVSPPTYPPCVNCGQPTESPRFDQCDRCHARAVVALFDMHVAEIKARHPVPGLWPSDRI